MTGGENYLWFERNGRYPAKNELDNLPLGSGEALCLSFLNLAEDCTRGLQVPDWHRIRTSVKYFLVAWLEDVPAGVYAIIEERLVAETCYMMFSWDGNILVILSAGHAPRSKAAISDAVSTAIERFKECYALPNGGAGIKRIR
ncbi:MAG: hypothetical protein IID50_01210 [Proteobacteria bacterium]|nr:hypothetical protein [Pseudomonadota bacterium]